MFKKAKFILYILILNLFIFDSVVFASETDETKNIEIENDIKKYIGQNIYDVVDLLNEDILIQYDINENLEEGTILDISIVEGKYCLTLSLVSLDENKKNKTFSLLDHFALASTYCLPSNLGPMVSGEEWEGYPVSYEYNWDNSNNCWYYGVWGGNGNLQNYKTKEGTYDSNVRHAMSLYCDGEYIYLKIIFASGYYGAANGNDFNFWIDDELIKCRVIYKDWSDLTVPHFPGTYEVKILHENNWCSGTEMQGSSGSLTVNWNNNNNILKIKIPISEFKKQNQNINDKTFSKVDFYTSNLMYRKISCGGAGYKPLFFIIGSIFIFLSSTIIASKKIYK